MNGNKADKRKRIGSEKNWNKFGEPFVRLLGGKFHTIQSWIKRKRKEHLKGELRGEQRTKKYER
jgi:hypothetical protein